MCLYPRLIKNPKYRKNKKNGGIIPDMSDPRVGLVPIGCSMCMECMKKRKNEWKVRLMEEIKESRNGVFVTFTFSNEAYKNLATEVRGKTSIKEGYALDNAVAKHAVRKFLERWRRKYKKSVRHWLVTELGHNGTERIHLHGIIWTDNYKEIERIWNNGKYKYGWVWDGKKVNDRRVNYVNQKTINYISKYITKVDLDHKYYKPIILCSPGIGRNYTKTHNAKTNKYKGEKTDESYTFITGKKGSLPIYYRNKIYTEQEREKLWIHKLDKEERWVGGEKVSIAKGEENYYKLLYWYRQRNTEFGYGSPENWDAREYEHQRRKLKQEEIWTGGRKRKDSQSQRRSEQSVSGGLRGKKAEGTLLEEKNIFKIIRSITDKEVEIIF